MSSSLFAPTTFATGPKDDVATVDVYTKDNSTPVTSITDKEDSYLPSKATVMRGGKLLKDSLPAIINITRAGSLVGNSKTSLLNNVLAGSSLVSSTFRLMPDSLKNGLISPENAKSYGDIFAKVDGAVRRVSVVDVKNVRSMGSYLGDITGKGGLVEIEDQDSNLAMLTGAVTEATRFGIPNSFSQVASLANNSKVLGRLANNVLPATLSNSDAKGLFDIASAVPYGSLNLLNPMAIQQFTTGYNAPAQCTAADYDSAYGNVMDAFKSVDNNWDKTVRLHTDGSTSTAMNITKLQDASPDMQRTLSIGVKNSEDPDQKFYSLASLYKKADVSNDISTQFPYAYLDPASRSSTPVTSPDAASELDLLRSGTTIT